MKYTTEQLDNIAEKLRDMPPIEKKKQEHSKQEAVKVLAKEISAMQKRGYSLDQISEALRGEGLAVATPTLKSYLQRAKLTGSKSKATTSANTTQTPLPAKTPAEASKAKFTPKEDSTDI